MSGTLINIGGRTNSGRSILAVTMAKNAILNGWMVAGNESFRKVFPYPTLADVPLDDEHDFDVNLKLAIFDDAERMNATLEPLIQRLLAYGTHVVTVTHAPSDRPVVSIVGQPEVFLIRVLLGDDLTACRALKDSFKSDQSHFVAASPEEAERILSNMSCRVSLHVGDRGRATGKPENCEINDHQLRDPGTKLLEAGHVHGMEYRHALEMGKWHPEMERFLADLPGRVGDPGHQEAFDRAKSLAEMGLARNANKSSGDDSVCCGHRSAEPSATATDSDGARFHTFVLEMTRAGKRPVPFATGLFLHGEDALKHSVCLGRSADGMSFPNRAASQDMHNFLQVQAFTRDLHDLLVKYAGVVNAPTSRRDGVQIAVSQKIVEMLSQSGDTSSYINNLRRFDVNQRD